MPKQMPAEKPAVIGEDGELVQPDTSVDPEAYTEYLATHVHRDPMWFRMRQNVRENRYVYLILAPWVMILGSLVLKPILTEWEQALVNFIFYASFVLMWIVAVCYLAFRPR